MSASFPKAPQGSSKRASWLRRLIAACNSNRVLGITGFSRRETSEGIFFDGIQSAFIAGLYFGKTIEVDETYTFPRRGGVIHIQASHYLVTTGIRDAANPTGPKVKSCAGIWFSTRNVPAKTKIGGNDVWNVPKWPMSNPSDLDDPVNYWYYLGEV